jgi:hypothetical protein
MINEIKTKKTIQRVNEAVSKSFETINKINKSSAIRTKQKREITQINTIKEEKWDITTNTNEI